MASEYLIDANVLIYAFDTGEPTKQERAEALIRWFGRSRSAAVSTQTLGEFYNAVMRKLAPPLSHEEAYRQLEAFQFAFTVCDMTPGIVLEAARAAHEYHLHYWDAQVWATAKFNEISYIVTEDIPGNDILEGIRFLNPFLPDFDKTLLTGG